MKYFLALVVTSFIFSQSANAEGGAQSFGLDVGLGFPYLTQFNATYRYNEQFSLVAGYYSTEVDIDEASLELTMPVLLLHYHPFSGSFFIGGGIGQQELDITATESTSSLSIKAEADVTATLAQLGWKWGASNGGFWFGLDATYIIPGSSDTSITAPGVPTSDPNYQDVQEGLDDFADSSFPTLTFVRLGWLF